VAVTQDELYAGIDLELSWSERALPEHVRTKHVHRLHPYHGKFIPQLVEVLLDRYFARGSHVLDPFAGSGTTLVQALESGHDATGVELAAFNCVLIGVKTASYDLESLGDELRDACARLDTLDVRRRPASPYVRRWYAPRALGELLAFRELIGEYEHRDVLHVVLSRAARSSRRAAHFDLEAPRAPQTAEYWCHKHKRTCRPVESAIGFLRRASAFYARYGITIERLLTDNGSAYVSAIHAAARRELELGAAEAGTSRASVESYVSGIARALANAAESVVPGGPLCIVVNDRRDLYPEILDRAGLRLDERLRRHVNRRTGRRAGEYFEDVLVVQKA